MIGDDLFVTNLERLERGIGLGAANAVLVKMNQIGTLTETLAVVERAQAGRLPHASSRPAPARRRTRRWPTSPSPPPRGRSRSARVAQSERLAKYNQLLRIEEELGADAPYAGRAALAL